MKILTVDLEDWFHILAHDETATPQQWEKFESRVERNTSWILARLDESKQAATFFCLGWIAKKYPSLIKEIAARGHEIACHSMNHQLVFEQSPDVFEDDLRNCVHLLEDLSGKKIKTYRAPGFSVSEKNNWVFEKLAACGIENDCSVFPVERNHGGYSGFPSMKPCIVRKNGTEIREFPMSVASIAGKNFVYSGGGYFRLLPYSLIRKLLKRSEYTMTYFHPRDFDPGQPMLASLPLKRKYMSYVGLSGAKKKFERLLSEFTFVNVAQASMQYSWDAVKPVILD